MYNHHLTEQQAAHLVVLVDEEVDVNLCSSLQLDELFCSGLRDQGHEPLQTICGTRHVKSVSGNMGRASYASKHGKTLQYACSL